MKPRNSADKQPKGRSNGAAPRYVPEVLRLDDGVSDAAYALCKGDQQGEPLRDALIAALGDLVAAERRPEWLILDSPFEEEIVHLAPPTFIASTTDRDSFWSHQEGETLIYAGGGRGILALEEPNEEGESIVDVKVPAADIGSIEGFTCPGEVVIWDLRWRDPVPTKRAHMDRLREGAWDALDEELAPYDRSG